MKAALVVFILSLTASVFARPPTFESEEYTDNNLSDLMPPEDEEERTDYVQM